MKTCARTARLTVSSGQAAHDAQRCWEDRDGSDPGNADLVNVRLGHSGGHPGGAEGATEIRRRIPVMPESPGLYQRLTVTENLDYFVPVRCAARKLGSAL